MHTDDDAGLDRDPESDADAPVEAAETTEGTTLPADDAGTATDGAATTTDEAEAATDESESTTDETETTTDPEAAFARLGNETRLRVIRELDEAASPPTFTDLFEASGEDTTAGFAYHLRRLVDHYVEKRPTDEDDEADARYVLTSAGRAVARALQAGVYTDRIARGPGAIDGDCPVCGAAALEAALADNVVRVVCTACGTKLLSLPFPPNGARDREMTALLSAFDAYHRRRLSLVADGVCPDCAGVAHGRIEAADPPDVASVEVADLDDAADRDGENDLEDAADSDDADAPGGDERPVVAAACESCSFALSAPVSLAVVDHPAVVAFFADHDAEPGPIWNLGPAWREAVLSTDPWAVRVSVRLGDGADAEELRVLVGDGPTVVDAERVSGE